MDKKFPQISMRVTRTQYHWISELAIIERRSVSEVSRMLWELGIANFLKTGQLFTAGVPRFAPVPQDDTKPVKPVKKVKARKRG